MNEYYATSKTTRKCPTPKKLLAGGIFLEYNPNIKMYRLNGENGIDGSLMGYTPHRAALLKQGFKYVS